MTGVRVLDLDEIRQLIDPAQALTAVREALIAHSRAQVTNPPPWHLELPDVAGEVHVKGAHNHDSPHLAVKNSTGFYGNATRGLPTSSGIVTVFDATTGQPARELHPAVLTRANRIAVDDLAQARSLGELKDLSDDAVTALPVVSLGALLAGYAPGRDGDTDITIADLTGLGAQDAALAGHIARRLLS